MSEKWSEDAKQEDNKAWAETQKKSFTRWANNHLQKRGFNLIEDAYTSFDDGITLCNLINTLYPHVPFPKLNKKPKARIHKLDNLTLALNMLENEAKIKTNFLKTTHLVDGNEKMILGMLWAIILDYQVKGISVDDFTAREGLLLWVKKSTKGYEHVDPPGVKGFSSDWRNGMVLLALINKYRPDLCNYSDFNPENAEQNIEFAFSVAEKELGIPRLLDVSDLTTEKPDERSVITYVSELFHKFSSQNEKNLAASRAQTFVSFLRKMQSWQTDFEQRVLTLLESIATHSSYFQNETPSNFDYYRQYISHQKPQLIISKIELEGFFLEIQNELVSNGRAIFVPRSGCSLEDVESALERLASTESSYSNRIRDSSVRNIPRPVQQSKELPAEKIEEFKAAYAHFDSDQDGFLTKDEFKAALTGLAVAVKGGEEGLHEVFLQVSEGQGFITLSQFLKYHQMLADTYSSQDANGILASFRELADGQDQISEQQLRQGGFSEEDISFVMSNNGSDYTNFVNSQFEK